MHQGAADQGSSSHPDRTRATFDRALLGDGLGACLPLQRLRRETDST